MHLVELKFLVHESLSQPELDYVLRNALPATAIEYRQKESDYYFRAANADFARVRYSDRGDVLTVDSPSFKSTVDLAPGSLSFPLMRSICGPEVAVLQRTATYFVLRHGVIVATVVAQGFDNVMLHVAGDNARDVAEIAEAMKDALREGNVELRPESRSDFEMFIEPLMALPRRGETK